MTNPITWLAERICRVEDHYPILPLMFFVDHYRPKYGLMTRNPTWRVVWYVALVDGAYFAPRWVAWLYRLLPLVFCWKPPESKRGGWLGPFIGGYGWHVGYVRASQVWEGDRARGYFVVWIAGHHWTSRPLDPPTPGTKYRLEDDGMHVEP